MKTIEERAEAIYKGNTIEEDAYKRGAIEQETIDDEAMDAIVEEQVLKAIKKQRAIDIEKACEWLRGYIGLDASLRYLSITHLLEDFREAMEE